MLWVMEMGVPEPPGAILSIPPADVCSLRGLSINPTWAQTSPDQALDIAHLACCNCSGPMVHDTWPLNGKGCSTVLQCSLGCMRCSRWHKEVLCLMDDDEHIGGLALSSYTLYIYNIYIYIRGYHNLWAVNPHHLGHFFEVFDSPQMGKAWLNRWYSCGRLCAHMNSQWRFHHPSRSSSECLWDKWRISYGHLNSIYQL